MRCCVGFYQVMGRRGRGVTMPVSSSAYFISTSPYIDVIPADFVDSGICTCVFVDLLSNRDEFYDFSGVFGSKIVCYTRYKLMNKF